MKNILCRICLLLCMLPLPTLALADAPRAGDPAPDVDLGSGLDGKPVRVADSNGQVVVLSFWASWCGPCRKELPQLEGLQRVAEQKKLGLQVVAVNIEDRETFRKIAPKLGEMHAKLVNERNKRSAAAYGVKGIPHLVIIGRDGRIVKIHVGYGEKSIDGILSEINAQLQAPVAPARS